MCVANPRANLVQPRPDARWIGFEVAFESAGELAKVDQALVVVQHSRCMLENRTSNMLYRDPTTTGRRHGCRLQSRPHRYRSNEGGRGVAPRCPKTGNV
jgi:hypothetical protein